MVAYELKSHNASVVSRGEVRSSESVHERDNAHLQRMGKKPVLKVRPHATVDALPFTATDRSPRSGTLEFCRFSALAVLFWGHGRVCLGMTWPLCSDRRSSR